jgi:hypothetical protein
MKKSILILSIASLILGFSSCKGDTKKSEDAATDITCLYSYESNTSSLEWTAFKFTDKTPVKGTFNEIKIEGSKTADDEKEMIESLTFTINTNSVETQNEERNGKIVKLFFGSINTDAITGKVKSLGDNGEAIIEIKMNNSAQEVAGNYTLDEGLFSFTATIDVMKWNAGKGISLLNEACKVLHTGPDGKSKLWSEVDLSFTTQLKSECN